MQIYRQKSILLYIASLLAIFFISIVVGQSISGTSVSFVILAILGAAVVILILINTDLALAILLVTMLLSPELGLGNVSGREIVIRLEDFLLAIISLTWLAKMAYKKGISFFLKTPLNKAIGIYLFICILSTTRGAILGFVDPLKGVFYVVRYFEYFLLFLLVANHIYSKKQIKFFLTVLFSTCAFVSLYGILQIPSGRRVSAPFEGQVGEPNTLGGYLLFVLCLAIGIVLQQVPERMKKKLFVLCLLIIFPFLYTLSRGSYLALFFALLTLIILSKKKKGLISALVLGVLLLFLLKPEAVFSRVRYTFETQRRDAARVGNVFLDPSSTARITSWKPSIKAWLEHPVLGRGITGFTFIDGQYIRTLPELGILGLLAFLWLLWTILKHSYRIHKEMDDELYIGLTLGFVAGFVGLMVHAITSNTFIIIRIMEPFWFLIGIIIMLPSIKKMEEANSFFSEKNVSFEKLNF
ncbi:MAG: O-antigen ligase family protein [Candidatus Aminicenantes bacterium]|nr:O-antigen ligase family protein [Candidatus Aminicenantes bacterium]